MTARPYTLRPATDRDVAFLYALHRATMRDYVARTWGWDEAFQRAHFAAHFDPARIEIVVVEGADAGMLAVERRAGELHLANVRIAPEYQGRGLGTAILAAVRAEAARAGLPVTLQVLKVNPARRLYERCGFRVSGETATHYLMRAEGPAVASRDIDR